ncbi:MAG: transcriptional repressor [Longicatena sp.]
MIRKQSKQRDIVLQYMKAMDGHASAEEIFAGLNTENQKVSLATVYRNLNILAEMNEIKKIAHPMYGYVYDKTCNPHYHLHCVKCNELLDLNIPYQESMNNEFSKLCNHDLQSHNLIFGGVCEECRKKSAN